MTRRDTERMCRYTSKSIMICEHEERLTVSAVSGGAARKNCGGKWLTGRVFGLRIRYDMVKGEEFDAENI